jgi:hypothetical protein
MELKRQKELERKIKL